MALGGGAAVTVSAAAAAAATAVAAVSAAVAASAAAAAAVAVASWAPAPAAVGPAKSVSSDGVAWSRDQGATLCNAVSEAGSGGACGALRAVCLSRRCSYSSADSVRSSCVVGC